MTTPATTDDAPGEAVHELANIMFVVATSVTYLLAHAPLDQGCRDVVADLKLCTDRFPELLGRLRVTSQNR